MSDDIYDELKVLCEHCNTRFNNRQPKKRKRYLLGQEDVLFCLNSKRQQQNKALLTERSVICHGCYRVGEYASSLSGSTNSDQEIEDMDFEEEALEERAARDLGSQSFPVPQLYPSLPQPQGYAAPPYAVPGPSSAFHQTGSQSPEKCAICPLIFAINPGVPKILLGSVEVIRLLLNGEQMDENKPRLERQHLICDPCFRSKAHTFSLMWQNLHLQFQNETERAAYHPDPAQSGRFDHGGTRHQESTTGQSEDETSDESDTSQSTPADTRSSDQSTRDSDENKSSSEEQENSEEDSDDNFEPPQKRLATAKVDTIEIPVTSIAVSGNICCICSKGSVFPRVPKKTRCFIWMTYGIYVSEINRYCKNHRDDTTESGISQAALHQILNQQLYQLTAFNAKSLTEFISFITEFGKQSKANTGRLSFHLDHQYTDSDYQTLLAVSKAHFYFLLEICQPRLKSRTIPIKNMLAMFLMKLRLNLNQKAMGCLFRVSQSAVSRAIKRVKEVLLKDFVPRYLGYGHIDRQDYIQNHTTQIAKTLLRAGEEEAIVVIDGTYLYFQKSRNYRLQRRTFSMHKFRNLLKVMMIVSTTGRILAIEGPFYGDGDNNDANILRSMARDANGFRSFFVPGDFIVEDRGFRDSNTLMAILGFSLKMPHFLGKRAQHPTSEANESRLITKIRWVVESVNGRIKNVFKFFRDTVPNTYIKKNRAYEYFQITCALLNAFHPPLARDNENDQQMAQDMLVRSEMHNLFMEHLKAENLLRSTKEWRLLNDAELRDFPRLTRDELREFTYGVYQLYQAMSYMSDSQNEFGNYNIHYHPYLGKNIVRFRIQSRFHSSREHFLWIGYNPIDQGVRSITGWYCKCANGSRVVGCCAHIAAVLWYLSYARYLGRVIPPGADLDNLVRDAPTYRYEFELLDVPTREEERQLAQNDNQVDMEELEMRSDDNAASDSNDSILTI